MRVPLHHAVAVALLVVAGTAGRAASAQGAEPSVRDRVAAERAAAEARYAQRESACRKRFVVTSCVDDAKRERRETLTRLERERNQSDDKSRKARAVERTESIRRREVAEAQSGLQNAVREPRETARRAAPEPRPLFAGDGASRPRSTPSAHGLPRSMGGDAPDPVARGEQEARSRATFDAAHRSAEAHRAEVEARNAQRAAKRKPAAPLPSGASGP